MSDKSKQEGEAEAPSWKEAFALRDDLRQRDVYAFEAAVSALGGFSKDGSSILAGHALKAAIEAGWLAAPASEVLQMPDGTKGVFQKLDGTSEVLQKLDGTKRYFVEGVDVDDLHPGKVRWYGTRIIDHYARSVTPPPN